MNKTKVKTAALPAAGLPFRFWLAAASLILALLAIPQIGHTQGIVRGGPRRAPTKVTGSPAP